MVKLIIYRGHDARYRVWLQLTTCGIYLVNYNIIIYNTRVFTRCFTAIAVARGIIIYTGNHIFNRTSIINIIKIIMSILNIEIT